MKHRLELELDVITDLSALELTAKVEKAVWEALEAVKPSFGSQLALDIFLVLDGHEDRLVMEPV